MPLDIKNMTREQKALVLMLTGNMSPEDFNKVHASGVQHGQAPPDVPTSAPINRDTIYGTDQYRDKNKYRAPGALVGALTGTRYGPGGIIAGGVGGGMSETPGDVLETAIAGGMPFPRGVNGGRVLGTLRGLFASGATSVTAQEGKSLVDQHKLVNPLNRTTLISALTGAVGGYGTARPADALTKAEQKAQASATAFADHQAATQQVESQIDKHAADVEKLNRQVTRFEQAHKDASGDLRDSTQALKAAETSASRGARKDYLTQYNKLSAEEQAKVAKLRQLKDDESDALGDLKSHAGDMQDKQDAATAAAAAKLRDQAVSLQNKNTLLSDGRQENGKVLPDNMRDSQGRFTTPSYEKAKNTISARNLTNAATKTKSGVDPVDFAHDPEDAQKLADLTDSHAQIVDQRTAAEKEIDAIRQNKADLKTRGSGNAAVDQSLYTAHEAATAAEDAAHAKMRAVQDAHRDLSDNLTDLQLQQKELARNAPPEMQGSMNARDKVGVAGDAASVLGLVGLPTSHIGTALRKVAGMMPDSPSVAPPSAIKKLLIDKLLANANSLQPAILQATQPDNPQP